MIAHLAVQTKIMYYVIVIFSEYFELREGRATVEEVLRLVRRTIGSTRYLAAHHLGDVEGMRAAQATSAARIIEDSH